jgi:hypothetical protein
MQRFIFFLKSVVSGFTHLLRWPFKFITRRRMFIGMTALSMIFISCIFGAAIIYFDLPFAGYLRRSFMGFEALVRHGKQGSTDTSSATQKGINRDDPEKTFDGFTLYSTTQGTTASLIDMRGKLVHQWSKSFSDVWPNPTHIKHRVNENMVHWFRCKLFPNGDLLAVYQADSDTPHGYGLVKLDKDSNIVWAFADNVHHDLDIADDGKIYALTHQISNERVNDIETIMPPYIADYLVILSPEGNLLGKISIIEAFQKSPYSLILKSFNAGSMRIQQSRAQGAPTQGSTDPIPTEKSTQLPGPPKQGMATPAANQKKTPGLKRATSPPMLKEQGDVLHANSVKILKREFAPKFALFKEGQVLISLCNLNAIAVLDVPSRSIVWATQGVWLAQHDAEFLENGHLLLYDNSGLSHNTRIIEFDPVTHAYPWTYTNENSFAFVAAHRGMKQHLPNGNVLIVDPDGGRLFEVNSAKSPVWEFGCSADDDEESNSRPIVTGAFRYPRSELKFLEGIPVRR